MKASIILARTLISLILGPVLASGYCASARIFVVTDTNDTIRVSSLRGAVIAANRIGGNNTITLGQTFKERRNEQGQWVYRLTISGADEDAARTGDLDITRGNLTIIGMSSNVTIDATGLGDRVFQVSSNVRLTLENLVVKGGTAPNGPGFFADGEPGGAIYNAGILTLEHCVITNNTSGGGQYVEGNGGGTGGGDGGGIYNAGTLWANDCGIVGNSSGAGVDGACGGNGGGIRNDGICFLTHCIIGGNQSGAGGGPAGNATGFAGSGGNGGGIFNSGAMVLNGCIIGTNAAGPGAGGGQPGIVDGSAPGAWGGTGGGGGGIYNVGQMEINFSSVYDNISGNGGSGGRGTGLYGSGGNAGAGGNGAGIFNAGELSLNTSTISGNLCGYGGTGGNAYGHAGAVGGTGGGGGGVYNVGSLDLTSCTIALNQTGPGGDGGNSDGGPSASSGGQGGDGGGILNDAGNTNAVIRNTLIALNLTNLGGAGGTNTEYLIMPGQEPTQQIGDPGANGLGFDVAGDFTSQGFNLIGMADGSSGFANGIKADQVGSNANPINPLLGPLQMNGGFTPTQALLPGSPAIDQGNSFGIHTDQRGDCRPYHYPGIPDAPGGDGSDIGAFELDTP